jgi:hypothetical protein
MGGFEDEQLDGVRDEYVEASYMNAWVILTL